MYYYMFALIFVLFVLYFLKDANTVTYVKTFYVL